MKNKTVLSMCIADINDLLTMAIRDHVLKDGEFTVQEVCWNSHDMSFKVTLEPKTFQTVSQ